MCSWKVLPFHHLHQTASLLLLGLKKVYFKFPEGPPKRYSHSLFFCLVYLQGQWTQAAPASFLFCPKGSVLQSKTGALKTVTVLRWTFCLCFIQFHSLAGGCMQRPRTWLFRPEFLVWNYIFYFIGDEIGGQKSQVAPLMFCSYRWWNLDGCPALLDFTKSTLCFHHSASYLDNRLLFSFFSEDLVT